MRTVGDAGDFLSVWIKQGEGDFHGDDLLVHRDPMYHWWLTGFRPGFFAYPQDLSLRISITFLDREMADSFADALIAKGYCPYDIELCSASVAFTFGIPHSFQPRLLRTWHST